MLFELYLSYFLLLLLLDLFYALLENTNGLLSLCFGRRVYLFGIFKLALKIILEFGYLFFLHFFELLHLFLVDNLDLDEFLFQLKILFHLKIYLLFVSPLELLCAIDV